MNENWKELVRVLAESDVDAADVITEYADRIGLKITKPQMARISTLDYERNKARKQIEGWKEDGKSVYTISDFPKDVMFNLLNEGKSADLIVRKIAENADRIPDIRYEFAEMNDMWYFTNRGYMHIIMGMKSDLEFDVWKDWKDGSGLFSRFA